MPNTATEQRASRSIASSPITMRAREKVSSISFQLLSASHYIISGGN